MDNTVEARRAKGLRSNDRRRDEYWDNIQKMLDRHARVRAFITSLDGDLPANNIWVSGSCWPIYITTELTIENKRRWYEALRKHSDLEVQPETVFEKHVDIDIHDETGTWFIQLTFVKCDESDCVIVPIREKVTEKKKVTYEIICPEGAEEAFAADQRIGQAWKDRDA